MGTIEERIGDNKNDTIYRARVRIKGAPSQSATFNRKSDAKKWIQKTETDMPIIDHADALKHARTKINLAQKAAGFKGDAGKLYQKLGSRKSRPRKKSVNAKDTNQLSLMID